ncbi:phospholipase B [Hymenopellis radicata]|nr:phospholipase B [Hymenopellis radicata]
MQLLPLSLLLISTPTTYAISIKDYAPTINIQCPSSSTPLVRVFSASHQTLHSAETAYVSARETAIADAWKQWMGDASSLGYKLDGVDAPRVGVALSGGSFRASLYGAGVLNAFDARNSTAKDKGTGGLLQVASYMSALSGGSWLASSLYANGWPTIQELVFGNGNDKAGWLLDFDLFFPTGKEITDAENVVFYADIVQSVLAKAATGIDTSLVDPWARALSYHFLNQTSRSNFFTDDSPHGAGQLWSDIPLSSSYQNHDGPFPIILANSRPNNDTSVGFLTPAAPVYEISPLELASFDPSLSAAADLKFVGSKLTGGKPDNSSSCVEGLDETGFVMGTSSSLFNKFLDDARKGLMGDGDSFFQVLKNIVSKVLEQFRTHDDDVANWPNPFKQIATFTFVDTNSDWLELIDGGSNGEVIPLGPLFVNVRAIDVIVAVDAGSDDDDNWPIGANLLFTRNRTSTFLKSSHQTFPPIPDSTDDFVKAGLNQRPTFFGCFPKNDPPEYPMVLYFPNSPPLTGKDPVTNTETLKLGYTANHQQLFLDQTFENTVGGFTPNSNDPDGDFGKCLQCAVVDRALPRSTDRSTFCNACFKQYCYDPSSPASAAELPNRKLKFVDPDPQKMSFRTKLVLIIVGAAVGGLVLFGLVGCL